MLKSTERSTWATDSHMNWLVFAKCFCHLDSGRGFQIIKQTTPNSLTDPELPRPKHYPHGMPAQRDKLSPHFRSCHAAPKRFFCGNHARLIYAMPFSRRGSSRHRGSHLPPALVSSCSISIFSLHDNRRLCWSHNYEGCKLEATGQPPACCKRVHACAYFRKLGYGARSCCNNPASPSFKGKGQGKASGNAQE